MRSGDWREAEAKGEGRDWVEESLPLDSHGR